jgi:hypothetical protein
MQTIPGTGKASTLRSPTPICQYYGLIEVHLSGNGISRTQHGASTDDLYISSTSSSPATRFSGLRRPRSLPEPSSTCIPNMPQALRVSADVRRSPTQSHTDTQLSPSVTRSPFHSRRNPPPRRTRPKLQAVTRDPPPWLPPKSSNPSIGHPATSSPPPSQLITAAVRLETAEPATFARRDPYVEILEAGLQKQGCLSSTGKMSSPTHPRPQHVPPAQVVARALPSQLEQTASHDPFIPAT